jgi:hypothetical protein
MEDECPASPGDTRTVYMTCLCNCGKKDNRKPGLPCRMLSTIQRMSPLPPKQKRVGRNRLVLKAKNSAGFMYYTTDNE